MLEARGGEMKLKTSELGGGKGDDTLIWVLFPGAPWGLHDKDLRKKKKLHFHYLDREEKKTNSLEMYPEKVTIFKNIHTKGCFFPQNKLFYQTEPYQTWGKGKEQLDNWNLF